MSILIIKELTLKPILVNFSLSTSKRPSKRKAGLFMFSYISTQLSSLNSFHSVAITMASAFLQASEADPAIETYFLTWIQWDGVSRWKYRHVLWSRGRRGLASCKSIQIWLCWTWGSKSLTMARSDRKSLTKVIAADSRVSPVSALKEKPRTAIVYRCANQYIIQWETINRTLPVIVLNRLSTTRLENLLFWYSFISTTCLQYAATSGRWQLSER